MNLPDVQLQCTAFIMAERDHGGVLMRDAVATAFFVRDEQRPDEIGVPLMVVTARHCIQEMRAEGVSSWLRVNTTTSFLDLPITADDWIEADDCDVAVAFLAQWPIALPFGESLSFSAIPLDQFINDEYRFVGSKQIPLPPGTLSQVVSVGHEVFFTGLFSQSPGRSKNLPIARFGHISRVPVEPIVVERKDGSTESVDGYLVEARSWGGHSGSPVFWTYPLSVVDFVDIPNPALRGANRQERRHSAQPTTVKIAVSRTTDHIMAFMGIVSAHFEITQQAQTRGDIFGTVHTDINAGMAVITPAHLVKRHLESQEVQVARAGVLQESKPYPAAVMDFLAPRPPDGTASEVTGIG